MISVAMNEVQWANSVQYCIQMYMGMWHFLTNQNKQQLEQMIHKRDRERIIVNQTTYSVNSNKMTSLKWLTLITLSTNNGRIWIVISSIIVKNLLSFVLYYTRTSKQYASHAHDSQSVRVNSRLNVTMSNCIHVQKKWLNNYFVL